jgi:hypothetical protein
MSRSNEMQFTVSSSFISNLYDNQEKYTSILS